MPTSSQRRILISTRIMRGLSGKVILLNYNIKALVAAGWDVSVFAEKIDKAMIESMGAQPFSVWNKLFSKPRRLQRFLDKHERLARSGRYDLVVGHGETLFQDVLHIHNSRHLEYEHIYGKTLIPGAKVTADIQAQQVAEQRYRLLVANSHLMRDDLITRYNADPERITVVYPGYDPERFYPRRDNPASIALRDQLGVGDRVLVGLVTSGKLIQRGADLLIPAIAGLPDELRRRMLTVIVAKDNLEPYQRQVAEAGLGDSVRFLAPRQDVDALYNALDIYINPARIETFGMSLLEAMACGVPCITTRGKVGAGELFTGDMQAGLMARADADALSDTLQQLLQSAELRLSHAALCAEAARPHDWSSNTRQHLALYEKVVAEKQLR